MEPFVTFVIGMLAGVIMTIIIGTMSMKRSGPSGSTAARKVVVTTPNDARLLSAVEAQKMSKTFNLCWMWISHETKYPGMTDPLGDGSKGKWYLRPVMAPTDTDANQGTILVHAWSERRMCWIPKLQCRSLKQLDEKLRQQGDAPAGREMCAHYFERVVIEGTDEHPHEQAYEGPEQSGKWPNLGEVINGIDVSDAQSDEVDERETGRRVKLEPREPRDLPRPKDVPRAKEFVFSPYTGERIRF